MSSLKRISPWIACLAVLLNMFAMPLSRAMQTPDVQLMLWGGFCSGGGSQALPPGFKKTIDTIQQRRQKRLCSTVIAAVAMLEWQRFPPTTTDTFYRNTHPTLPSKILNCRSSIPGFVGQASVHAPLPSPDHTPRTLSGAASLNRLAASKEAKRP